MNAWQEKGRKAMRYLGEEVPPQELKRGDIIIGFHLEPIAVVESAPVPHHGKEGWWTYEAANWIGVGTYLFTENGTARVGRVPLRRPDPNAYVSLWQAPCGCAVNKGEHCEECGPYNAFSPLYAAKGQSQ